MLSSSFLLPHPSTSWPTLSAKTVFTSERLGLVFLTTVLPTLSTLCCHQCCRARSMWEENPAQNLTALKEKDQGNKRCFSRMEARLQPACQPPSRSQQPCSLPWIPFSHCTGHASIFDRGVESTLRKQIALMLHGLSCAKQGRSSLKFLLTVPFQVPLIACA